MSIASGIISGIIKRFNNKKFYEDDDAFQEYLDKKRISNSKSYNLRYPFSSYIVVEKQKIDSMTYYVFNRKNSKKTIFYFHGGSYIDKPSMFHFKFVEKMLLNKKVCVVFPIYPRLPDNTYSVAYSKLNKLFNDFVEKNPVESVVFMGDSAGGGLALGMAQNISNSHNFVNNEKQKVVLLSPWLDVSTDNPDMEAIEPNDYQLSRIGLAKLGKIWAEGNTKRAPASPLYGHLSCGKISLIIGTRDILYADALKLKAICERDDVPIEFIEYANMPHCFMLMPTPEADKAFVKIMGWL